MELTGKVIDVLPITSGTSKAGKAWKKQIVAIEIPGQYPKTVAFSFFGDKCENHGLTVGQEATIHVNIESRKYNDTYFTEVSCWKVELIGYQHSGNTPSSRPQENVQRSPDPVPQQFESNQSDDDLPF